jgi:hypothetical protein
MLSPLKLLAENALKNFAGRKGSFATSVEVQEDFIESHVGIYINAQIAESRFQFAREQFLKEVVYPYASGLPLFG